MTDIATTTEFPQRQERRIGNKQPRMCPRRPRRQTKAHDFQRKAELLKKRQENINRRMMRLNNEETKLKDRLEFISAQLQTLDGEAACSSSFSPSPERKLHRLRKSQENITHRLTRIAEKEDKPPKMIANEARLKQRLEVVSSKIAALEDGSSSPSSSSAPRQLDRLRKCQGNITRRLARIAEKEDKPPKMIANEARMKQRLEVVSSKIAALEGASSPSPSSSSLSTTDDLSEKIQEVSLEEVGDEEMTVD